MEKLIRLLTLIENAETAADAVWLPADDRRVVAEIRRTLEEQA